MFEQCFWLGSECHTPGHTRKIERLYAQSIARQNEAPPPRIPQREGKHPVQMVQKVEAMFLVKMYEHLGIGVISGEMVAGVSQDVAQLNMIVNFAIENDRDGPILVEHRLLPGRNIDDCQATHAERDVGPLPIADVIRSAMAQALGH